MNQAMIVNTRHALERAHAAERRDARPQWEQTPCTLPYNLFLLFNIQAAFDEGHTVLALGPVGGDIMTYSFYRHGNALKGPGLMACLRTPEPFEQLVHDSGWLVHGGPGHYWNEHMDTAIAMACDEPTYQAVRAFAEQTKANPPTYNLISNNCLTFSLHALEAGGVRLLTREGHVVHTFVPRDAFDNARSVRGAQPFGAWKYWFPQTPPPQNGLTSISDFSEQLVPGSEA